MAVRRDVSTTFTFPLEKQSRQHQNIKDWDISISGIEDAERVQTWLNLENQGERRNATAVPPFLRVRIEIDSRLMDSERNQEILSPIWTILASNKDRFVHFKFDCVGYPFPVVHVDILSTILSGATCLQDCTISQVRLQGDLSTLGRDLQFCPSLQSLELFRVYSDDESTTVDPLLFHIPDSLREISLFQAKLSADAWLAISSGKKLSNQDWQLHDESSNHDHLDLSNTKNDCKIERLTFKFCPGMTNKDWTRMLVHGMAHHPTCQFLNLEIRTCTEPHTTTTQQQLCTQQDELTFWYACGEMLKRNKTLKKVWIMFHENREAILSRLQTDLLHLADSLRGNTSLSELHLCIKVPRSYHSDYENERVWNAFAAMLKQDNFALQFFSMGYNLLGIHVQLEQSDEVAFYTELNRAGRRFLLANEQKSGSQSSSTIVDKVGATREDWLRVILTHKDNASIVFYFLVRNPSILIGVNVY